MSKLTEAIIAAGRCPICGWPLTADGCSPENCSYRPQEGSAEDARIQDRRAELAEAEVDDLQRRKAEALDWLSIGSRVCDMIRYPKGTTVEYQYIGDGWVVYGGTLLECAEAAMRKEAGNG